MFPLRDENPTHSFPFITVILIVANVVIFFFQASMPEPAMTAFVMQFAAIPTEVMTNTNLPDSTGLPPYISVVTSMFLHGGLMHLVGNMWFLWIFGDNIEDSIGHVGFTIFYLATGIAATLTHVAFNTDSTIPLIGASGAISGVLGAYVVLHPTIRVNTLLVFGFFWRVIQVPAIFFLGLWFAMQIFGGFQAGDNVAYGAHIGGFVAGIPLIFLFTRRDPRPHARYESIRARRW